MPDRGDRRRRVPPTQQGHQREVEPPPPAGIMPVLLYALTTQGVLLLALAIFWILFGSAAYFIHYWLAMILAILSGGVLLIASPVLFRGATEAIGLGRHTRSPGFAYDLGMGALLVTVGILGVVVTERLLWQQCATLVAIDHPEDLVVGNAANPLAESSLYYIPELSTVSGVRGVKVQSWRHRDSHRTTTHWYVVPLVPASWDVRAAARRARAGEIPSCLWLGWSPDSGFATLQYPRLGPPGDAGAYYVNNPAERHDYLQGAERGA